MNVPLTPIRFLRYANEQFSSREAVVCGKERFTYAEFAERAGRLARALISSGATPGERIAFLSTNCHRLLEAYYGVLEADCVLMPVNIRLAPQELAFILNDAGASFLFFERQFLPIVEQLRPMIRRVRHIIPLDSNESAPWIAPVNYEECLHTSSTFRRDLMAVDEDSLAELFYTSGTSANPKGVMLTHRNVYLHALSVLAASQTCSATAGHLSCDTVQLHIIPLFHANGWGNAHTVTVVGGKHVMIHHFDPAEVFRLIQDEKVTSCALVPTMANALINSPLRSQYDLSSLQTINIGGAASSPTLVQQVEEKLGCACFSGYGLTETSPVVAMSTAKPGLKWSEEERYTGQARTGFAIPGVELRVVDSQGRDVLRNAQTLGEIIVRSDNVMDGYWRQPDATESAMENGWFHTGDIATIDQNNYLLIVDRKKDIIVSGGENISSLELEKTLSAHPQVYEVAVIAVPDEKWGEVPKALVVRKPDSSINEQELLEFCRSQLSHYKCPRSIEFVESLPKTGTGKLMKKEMREKYWSSQSATGSQV